MISSTPKLTDAGNDILIRGMCGERITFTRFKAGNGELPLNSDGMELTDLINPILEFGISEIDTSEEGYARLIGKFDSSDITADFRCREFGVFCKGEGEDAPEVLYAYTNDGDNSGMLRANATDVLSEQTIELIVVIDKAMQVTALISPSVLYASKSEFDEHVNDFENPHKTTKEQVGLGNVANVTPEDMAPEWEISAQTTTQEINPRETMSNMLGKIARAIKNLIAHISNRNNPHESTYEQVGAAAKSHNHSAADINSGVLGLPRGGTGVTTLAELQKLIGGQIKIGSYTGNGGGDREISLGYAPDALIFASSSATRAMPDPQCYFLTKDIQVFSTGHGGHAVGPQTWDSSCSKLMITTKGFKVDTTLNQIGWTYVYAAIKVAQ